MHPKIVRNLFMPIADRLKGMNTMRYLKELERSQWLSRGEIEALQQEKLKQLIKHSYQNVPYYHEVFTKMKIKPDDIKTVADLSKLPVLTKNIIRRNFPDRMIARNFDSKSFLSSHSSGSTGEPLKFYTTQYAADMTRAAMFRAWGWAGFELGDKVINLSGFPHEILGTSRLMKRINYRLSGYRFLQAFNLEESTLNQYIDIIRTYKPKAIRGYSSSVYLLAKAMKENGIDDVHVDTIMTHGETLSSVMRQMIEEHFGSPVFDGYGGEGMTISSECEQHCGYHIAADNVVVEFVHISKPAAREFGQILVTDLNNYAMPFIRYQIGDVGKPSYSACICGRGLPLMQSIEGRVPDMIITPGGKILVVHFFTGLFEHIHSVEQFQIIQEIPNELIVKLVKNNQFKLTDETHIIGKIQNYAGEEMKVMLDYVDEIPRSQSGKRRFIISKITEEPARLH
ncbi:Phenylacetate-coenzyme A ligase [subsurface metagenome]